jgi:hypothetical protein
MDNIQSCEEAFQKWWEANKQKFSPLSRTKTRAIWGDGWDHGIKCSMNAFATALQKANNEEQYDK